jgi:23S rRNA pseudouridine1911/1915/1917 synthase
VIRFSPAPDEVGQRIDVVLAHRAGVTRTLAQRALRAERVAVSGRAVRPSHRLEESDVVEGVLPPPAITPPGPEDVPLAIRYSDADVLVVSKPAGLVTHPAAGHEAGTLVNALLGLGVPLSAEGSTRPGVVHRLDKDTSGLLLVAKSDASHALLVDALRSRRVERGYLALVRGRPAAESGTVEAPVARDPARRTRMAVLPGGRPSVTHYLVLAAAPGMGLLDVRLETGRTHQIRVHLAHLGHPVLGDGLYGGRSDLSARLGLARPFLHAYRLVFPRPSDGERIEIHDPLPPDLAGALEAAGLADPFRPPGA